MRPGIFLVLIALPALAAPNPSLEKAARLLEDLNYADANRAIDAALKQPGNDRATLLKALQLQAIILATLGQAEKASQAFSQLLALDAEFALTGNHPPRVTTAFYEARAWSAANGRLEVKALDPVLEPGQVKAVRVEVTKDPARQVKKVRFLIAGTPVVIPVTARPSTALGMNGGVTGGVASAAPKSKAVEVSWWAEVLGDKDAVLVSVGSESAPESARAPAAETPPVKQAEATPPPPPAELKRPAAPPETPIAAPPPEPAPVVRRAPGGGSSGISGGRIAGIALFGVGIVGVGVGSGFGVMSAATRAQVNGAMANGAGVVTSLTQKQAYDLDARQRMEATISNALFISGGVLAASGVVLFLVSGSSSSVAILPAGPGITVVGTLP